MRCVVVLCAACAAPAPKPTTPAPIVERFAVGVMPSHDVPRLVGEGSYCHDVFVPNRVFDGSKLVAEGTFEGHCPDSDARETFEAVRAARLVVEIDATMEQLGNVLGATDRVVLDASHPDWQVSLVAQVTDPSGAKLSQGATNDITTWTVPPACDAVVKLVPFADTPPTFGAMQLAPVAAGSCTIHVAELGLEHALAVVVR